MEKRSHKFDLNIQAIAIALLVWNHGVFADVVMVDSETQKAIELFQAGNTELAISRITIKAYEGVVAAQYNLAVIYAQDQDTELSRQQMKFWLNKAAESGDAESQFNLAMLYYADQEGEKWLENTIRWLTNSAKKGNAKAQYNLGYMGISNLETGISKRKGEEWLHKAEQADNDRAKTLVSLLKKNNKLESTQKLYGVDLQFRIESKKLVYATKQDDTKIYAFPATLQKPLLVLEKGVTVKIVEKRNDWLGVRVEDGFPSWIASEELVLKGNTAIVIDLEANMYTEPVENQEAFKIGVVNRDEKLKVLEFKNGWVKVATPDYFLAWIKEQDIIALPAD